MFLVWRSTFVSLPTVRMPNSLDMVVAFLKAFSRVPFFLSYNQSILLSTTQIDIVFELISDHIFLEAYLPQLVILMDPKIRGDRRLVVWWTNGR